MANGYIRIFENNIERREGGRFFKKPLARITFTIANGIVERVYFPDKILLLDIGTELDSVDGSSEFNGAYAKIAAPAILKCDGFIEDGIIRYSCDASITSARHFGVAAHISVDLFTNMPEEVSADGTYVYDIVGIGISGETVGNDDGNDNN